MRTAICCYWCCGKWVSEQEGETEACFYQKIDLKWRYILCVSVVPESNDDKFVFHLFLLLFKEHQPSDRSQIASIRGIRKYYKCQFFLRLEIKKCCSLLKLTLFALHNETGVGKFVYQKSFGKREPEIKSLNNCGNINWTSLNYFIALSIDSWGKNISCFPTRTDLNIASRRRDEYFLETTRTWYEFKWLFFLVLLRVRVNFVGRDAGGRSSSVCLSVCRYVCWLLLSTFSNLIFA